MEIAKSSWLEHFLAPTVHARFFESGDYLFFPGIMNVHILEVRFTADKGGNGLGQVKFLFQFGVVFD